MLTTLKVYSPWATAPTLLLEAGGRPESDLIQIRNIEGLDPVKAAINTAALGSVDGTAFIGADVNTSRNIVLTLHPNPDWDEWSYDTLRNLIYAYFTPKKTIALVFHSDDILPVKILGYTEDVTLNPFSKDPEYQVSIICPDPYFTSLEPIVVEGATDQFPYPIINYSGSVEVGINVEISSHIAMSNGQVNLQVIPEAGLRIKPVVLSDHMYMIMSSMPGDKYIHNVSNDTGAITSLLSSLFPGANWPVLIPGANELNFSVFDNSGSIAAGSYKLTYSEKYIGL